MNSLMIGTPKLDVQEISTSQSTTHRHEKHTATVNKPNLYSGRGQACRLGLLGPPQRGTSPARSGHEAANNIGILRWPALVERVCGAETSSAPHFSSSNNDLMIC